MIQIFYGAQRFIIFLLYLERIICEFSRQNIRRAFLINPFHLFISDIKLVGEIHNLIICTIMEPNCDVILMHGRTIPVFLNLLKKCHCFQSDIFILEQQNGGREIDPFVGRQVSRQRIISRKPHIFLVTIKQFYGVTIHHDSVDSIGTIHVSWDCGSSLGVAYGVDQCRKVVED